MRDRNLHTILAVLLLSALVTGCATMTVPEPGSSAPAMTAQVAKAAASGPQEGIKVHGNWVIEVKNPDGTLADRREFKNALITDGKNSLIQFLGRQNSVGLWLITLEGTPHPCLITLFGPNTPCRVLESASNFTANHVFKTLTVSVSGNNIVLDGTATAQANSAINSVTTLVDRCDSTIPPSTPCEIFPWAFTGTMLSPTSSPLGPIPVSPGQQIQVTVTISFS